MQTLIIWAVLKIHQPVILYLIHVLL